MSLNLFLSQVAEAVGKTPQERLIKLLSCRLPKHILSDFDGYIKTLDLSSKQKKKLSALATECNRRKFKPVKIALSDGNVTYIGVNKVKGITYEKAKGHLIVKSEDGLNVLLNRMRDLQKNNNPRLIEYLVVSLEQQNIIMPNDLKIQNQLLFFS